MKKHFLFILLILPLFSISQDFIFKINGDEIKAKIVEIGKDEIKYKKFENLQGPTYVIEKSLIFLIKYENGSKDVFNNDIKDNKNDSKEVKSETSVNKGTINLNAKDLGKVIPNGNKLVFLYGTPIGKYEIAFKFENIVSSLAIPSIMASESISNADYQSSLIGVNYDGIILAEGANYDVAIKFIDKDFDNSLIQVNSYRGKPVFFNSKPIKEYKVVGNVLLDKLDTKTSLKRGMKTVNAIMDEMFLNGWYRKITETDRVQYDAILYSDYKDNTLIKY
jgi:hypothetical protein